MASLVPQPLNNIAQQATPNGAAPQPLDQVQQLLAQLQDPIAPEAIGIWPPAVGWWFVALFVLIGIVAGAIYFINKSNKNAYRKIALKKLKAVKSHEPHQQLFEINGILQQTLLAAYPALRQHMGRLYGAEETQIFSATCTNLPQEQQNAIALVTSDQKYAPQNQAVVDDVLKASRYWVKHHTAVSAKQIDLIFNQLREANR